MIRIYCDKRECIQPLDAYFNTRVSLKDFDDTCKKYMMEIDGAEILDMEAECVKTPHGICGKEHLSTGLKTVVVVYLLIKKGENAIVSIDECGENAMSIIFELADKQKEQTVALELHHDCICEDKEYKFLLNDTKVCDDIYSLCMEMYRFRRKGR